MITFLDTLLQSMALKSSCSACTDYLFVKVRVMIRVKVRVMIRVKVRVMIRVKVRILKIQNNDIRNQKQNRKIILLARDHIRLYSYIVRSVSTLHIVPYFFNNLLILYDYFASIKMFLLIYILYIVNIFS